MERIYEETLKDPTEHQNMSAKEKQMRSTNTSMGSKRSNTTKDDREAEEAKRKERQEAALSQSRKRRAQKKATLEDTYVPEKDDNFLEKGTSKDGGGFESTLAGAMEDERKTAKLEH